MSRFFDVHTHSLNSSLDNISIYNLLQQDVLSNSFVPKANIYYSVGMHPWDVHQKQLDQGSLRKFILENRVVAIGESGLDKLCKNPFERQVEFFRSQIELAKELNLPMIIHCVKAWDELLFLYREYKPRKPWIIHGFRGNKEQAIQLIKHGFWFSLGEYYNKNALSVLYPDKLLLETDTSDIRIEAIYENVSRDLGLNINEIATQVEQNVSTVFNLRV